MSVSYIFEDRVVGVWPYTFPDQTYAYVGLGMDLTLLANAPGVTDSSRFYAGELDWTWITENAGMTADQLFTYTCLIRLTADTAVLTVGGDYSKESNKYNLSITCKDSPYRVSAARTEGDLRLVLVAQSGAAGASGNLDRYISIYAKSQVSRDRKTVFKSNAPTTNDASALGYDVAGSLIVSSDLLGNVTTVTDASLMGIRIPDGDKTKPVNTSVSQRADAIAVRAANITLIRNFNAVFTSTSTMETAGYASLTVTGNSAAAVGIRVYGDLSAKAGEWNGVIKATASKSTGKADKDSLDGSITSYSPASVSNNDFSAYGIWADGTIKIAHMRGDASETEITAINTGHKLVAEASADSNASISMSNNGISAYGIKGKTVTLDRVDDTFSISATNTGHTVTATLSGKTPVLSLSDNLVAAVGIEAETLTTGSFNGKITVGESNISVTLNGADEESTIDTTYFNVSGINATHFNAEDNLGGVITVSANKVVGAKDSTSSKLEVFGICASSDMKVTGRIDTDITITGSGNNVKAEMTKAVYSEYIIADAFSGSMTSAIDSAITIGIQGNKCISTADPDSVSGTAQKLYLLAMADAFDINGTITGFDCGVASLGLLNLRVSGSIDVDENGLVVAAERYFVIKSGELFEIINPSTSLADKVEFSSTANVKGKIELGRGENSVVINSGATIDGRLLATDGLMNIRFDLDGGVNRSAAIVKTTLDDISLTSTSTISINLNNSQTGTYKLFQYDKDTAATYWKNTTIPKQVTFTYLDQREVLTVSKDGTATASFTDAAGNVVTATLTCSGKLVTVDVVNGCSLDDFAGECSTTFDEVARTATLSWTGTAAFDYYEVEYSIDGGNTITVLVNSKLNSTTINGIDSGTKINWRVRGNTGEGIEVSKWSEWSGDLGYEDDVPGAPTAPATPRAVNPDEEGGGVTAARTRFTWESATGGLEIAGYDAEFIVSKSALTKNEVAEVYLNIEDPSHELDPELKAKLLSYFTKYTTATEVLVSSLTNQSYVYWRVRAVDVNNEKSEFTDGEFFRVGVGDNEKPVWRALTDEDTRGSSWCDVEYDRSDAFNVKINVSFGWISALDSLSGVKSYLIQYKLSSDSWLDETKVFSPDPVYDDGSKTYTTSLSGLKGGLYDYRIKAVDYVGNESSYLVEAQFGAADLTPPTGRFSSFSTPTVTGEWSEAQTVTTTDEEGNETTTEIPAELIGVTVKLAWSDTFTDDSGIVYTVEVSDNADFMGKRVYSFETTEKSLTLDDSVGTASAVLAGMSKVYYRVSVKDDQGNVNPFSSATQSFDMVDSSTGEAISFSATASAPTNLGSSKKKVQVGSNYRTDLTFSWSNGDNNFGVYDYTLAVTVNGKTETYKGITSTSYKLSNQVDGNYTWKVTANTGTGSSATATGSSFTVDATAPTFADGAGATVVTSLNDFAINWDAATDKSGIAGYVLLYGTGTDTSTWASTSVTTTSFKGSISSSGDYNYRIYAIDKYNNTSLEAQSFLAGSFTISTDSHTSSDTARALSVTGVYDDPAQSFGSVGLAATSEWFTFNVDEADSDVYVTIGDVVSSYNSGTGVTVNCYAAGNLGKALFSTSVGSGTRVLQQHLDAAGDYYLKVTPNKLSSIMGYSVAVADDVPTAEELSSEDDAWNGYDATAGKRISAKDYAGQYRMAIVHDADTGDVEQALLQDYVGKSDAVDYRRFDVSTAGSYEFTLDGVASPLEFTISSVVLDSLGNVASLKSVKKVTLSPKYDSKKKEWVATVSTGNLLLDKGSYYFSVTATGAKNNKNSVYDVAVSGEAFIKVNTADDDWQKLAPEYIESVAAGTAVIDIDLFENEWVGYGDAVDYRKLTIGQSGNYNFTISGASNAATLTLYTYNEKTGKLVKYKSISVDAKKQTASTGNLLVLAGTEYYVAVTATGAKSGKNTDYEVVVTGEGFVRGNNEDDDWAKLRNGGEEYDKYKKTIASGTKELERFELFKEERPAAEYPDPTEWVGYGDAADFRKLTVDQTGRYDFTIYDVDNSATLTIYTYNEKKDKLDKYKSVTVNGTKVHDGTISGLLVEAGTEYYVEVKANNAKTAKNTPYLVAVDGEGFVRINNEDDDWSNLRKEGEGYEKYDKYKKTIASGTEKVERFELFKEERPAAEYPDPMEWVGFGDASDYRKLTINQTGRYDFTLTGVENSATLTIYTYNEKKDKLDKYKTITVNGTKAHDGTISGLLVEAGTEYYVEVKANDAKKGKNTDYEVLVTGTGFVNANQQVDDTWEEAAAGTVETTKKVLVYKADGSVADTVISKNEWVGFGDTVDYREITIGAAGQYNFNVNLGGEQNNVKLTVWSLTENKKGEKVAKSIKSITVNAAKTNVGEISKLLLDDGTYYVSVEATDAKKGKNSQYDLSITGTGFIRGNDEDDDWTNLRTEGEGYEKYDKYKKTIDYGTENPELTLFREERPAAEYPDPTEWVGFGDASDYRKLTISQTGSYDFTLTGVTNSATLTIYTYNEKTSKLVKYKTVTVDGSKATKGTISGVLVDAVAADVEFYVEVKANNAKTAKNTSYEVTVDGTGFVNIETKDNDWTALSKYGNTYVISKEKPQVDAWVGFGDKIDYRAISINAQGGIYTFTVSGHDGGVENNVKLTVYTENNGKLKSVKSVTATVKNGSATTGDLCLAAGNTYYLAVEAPDAAKGKNSDYSLTMVEKGVFTHLDNNTWDDATVPGGTPFAFDGVLTKSSGGDALDFISLNDVDHDRLAVDAASGKVKVSFYGENRKAVKVAEVTMADGTVKKNVSSLTLVADNKTTDNFDIAALDDAVKYLKIEALTTGMDSYKLTLGKLA